MALCGCMEAFRGLSMVRAPSQALRNGTDLVRIRAKPRALSGRFAVNGHASIPLTGNAAPLLAFLQHRMATHRIEIGTRIGHVFMPHDSGCAQGSDSRLGAAEPDVSTGDRTEKAKDDWCMLVTCISDKSTSPSSSSAAGASSA